MKIYKVGGAVRDRLLGLKVKDVDWVVVGALPEEMIALGYKQVGKDFPVFLHPKTHEEYALARKERKVAPGYKGFEFDTAKSVTLEEDLLRRDITINAMAEDDTGAVFDPFNGQKDLEKKTLRHVSDAFKEDPVRILRIARFAARFDFQIADETLELMKAMVASGEVDALVAERVWAELEQALKEDTPVRFFEVLQLCGAVEKIFPEIDRLFGVPQPAKHHPEIDTGIHTFMVLEQATKLSADPQVRFAALVHDLGKGTTPADILPSHHGHEERGVDLIKQLCERLRIPNDYRDLGVMVSRFHTHCHRIRELKPTTILKTLERMDVFRKPDRFDQFLLACEADARGRTGLEKNPYPQPEYFKKYQLAAASVEAKTIVRPGMTGQQIAGKIKEERVRVLKQQTIANHQR